MKIGVIADIHGNLPALQAVLAAMPRLDALLCCGDVVGYYPDVNEVCALLRDREALGVRGNHDAYVIGELQPNHGKSEIYRTDWTRSTLDPAHLRWLAALPIELQFKWGLMQLIIRHANPWDEERYLHADSPYLNEIALRKNEILVVGHTHHPMLVRAGNGTLLNPGSVGQPRDGNPQASYATIVTENRTIEFGRVSYNVSDMQSRLESLGWNKDMIQILGGVWQKGKSE